MKEYRLRIEDDLHKELKIWAIEQGKTINEIIEEILKDWMRILLSEGLSRGSEKDQG